MNENLWTLSIAKLSRTGLHYLRKKTQNAIVNSDKAQKSGYNRSQQKHKLVLSGKL